MEKANEPVSKNKKFIKLIEIIVKNKGNIYEVLLEHKEIYGNNTQIYEQLRIETIKFLTDSLLRLPDEIVDEMIEGIKKFYNEP